MKNILPQQALFQKFNSEYERGLETQETTQGRYRIGDFQSGYLLFAALFFSDFNVKNCCASDKKSELLLVGAKNSENVCSLPRK